MLPVKGDPLVISGFKGLWARGAPDECPPDHLISCTNLMFPGASECVVRPSITVAQALGGAGTQSVFQGFISGTSHIINMDVTGNLYIDGVFKIAWATADDFAAINLYNRIYLCPKKNGYAVSGEHLFYYDGTNFHQAGGSAPIAAPTLAQTIAGSVPAGVHGVSVLFQTRTGFRSAPGPIANITSTGTNDIEISNIPTGGSDVVARVIVVTKANELELFFVPNGVINDNVTTTLNIDFLDTDLTVSADYLNDILSSIPAGAALRLYNGRLIIVGPATDPKKVIVSNVQDPETFNNVTGIISVPTANDGNDPSTCWNIRGILYIAKPQGTYTSQDNSGDPSTWPLDVVDPALGCYDRGISTFSMKDPGSTQYDSALIATKSGFFLFTGVYQSPPLSWKIEDKWIGIINLNLVMVAHDVINKRFYVTTGDGVTLWYGDYREGLNSSNIKWAVWSFGLFYIGFVGMMYLTSDFLYTLRLAASNSTSLYTLGVNPGGNDPGAAKIIWDFATYLASKSLGNISVYTGLRLRVSGTGVIDVDLIAEGISVLVQTYSPFLTLTSPSGKDWFHLLNFTAEKVAVRIYPHAAVGGTTVYFWINRLDLFGVPRWVTRPALA